jgi:UDP-glucose 4-epimerase
MDGRSLNYEQYLSEGERDEVLLEDYTSLNTRRLSVPELQELLGTLPQVRQALASVGVRP